MPITALPTPPSRQDPVNFSARTDAFLAALLLFATELNAMTPGDSAAGLAQHLADASNPAYGDALVATMADFASAVPTTQRMVNRWGVSAMSWLTIEQQVDFLTRAFTLDISAAVQKICDEAPNVKVVWPAGLGRMDSGVTHAQAHQINWVGAGKTATELRASGAFNALLTLGGLSDQKIRGRIQDMCFSGQGATLQYGVYGARVEEHDFVGVWFRNAATAGCSLGYGYVNNFLLCEFSYNAGSGFSTNYGHPARANNALNFRDCLIFSNAKHGLFLRGGYVVTVHGCTIEQNAFSGIYADNISGLSVSSYFEQNAATGVTFTTPALTVKSDIVLVGSLADGTLDNTYPCIGVDISGCRVNVGSGVAHTSFIWNGGCRDLTVTSCLADNPTDTGACVAEHHSSIYKDSNTSIANCSTFSAPVAFVGASAAVNNTNAAYFKVQDFRGNGVQAKNYAEVDLNLWGVVVAANAITYKRSTDAANYKLNGNPVWEMATGLAGTSSTYGKSITATDYPELVGKLVWFGVWVKAASATCYAVPYCSAQTFNVNPTAVGVWTFIANSFVWPASGTVEFGVYKTGAAAAGSIFFSSPMLSIVGVPNSELMASCYKAEQEWQGSAAPAAGTWPVRAVVWNTAPASGGTPGWVCTTAPNTFKAMSNLA
jgi:hypothetical protein